MQKVNMDSEILHKIIEFQSSIIQGMDIKTLLNQNIDFCLDKSSADIITIYMHEHEKVNVECILEKEKLFTQLLKKYVFDKKEFRWEKFVQNCDKHFSTGIQYSISTQLYPILKGFLSKKEADAFTSELQMKNAIMMPIYAFDNKTKLGYIFFIYQSNNKINFEKLQEITFLFQIILQPLYDKEHNIMYTKCIRIDENMSLLTDQEKKIVQKVLEGTSYVDIAEVLGLSINTIKTHMKNIFSKYSVNSKIELFNKLSIYH